MPTSHVLFRVDASSEIGLGHLMRCLSLAQALAKLQVSSTFAVNEAALQVCHSRDDWLGDIIVAPYSEDKDKQIAWLHELVEQRNFNAMVLDGYHFDQQYRQKLYQINCFHICFDDLNQLEQLCCDLVINGASNATEMNYQQTAPNAVLCLGEPYRVLRNEFNIQQTFELVQRNYLTIVMGGSDPLNLTLPILNELQQQGFVDQVQVITGAAYPWNAELKSFLLQSKLRVTHSHNCQNMAQRFNLSRLVVSAAGGSQFELQACGCPSVLLVVADNQYNATDQAAEQGWCEMWDMRGTHLEDEIKHLVDNVIKLWDEQNLLNKMSQQAYLTRDINGAARVANAILTGIKGQ